jgi:hypothetical protein
MILYDFVEIDAGLHKGKGQPKEKKGGSPYKGSL